MSTEGNFITLRSRERFLIDENDVARALAPAVPPLTTALGSCRVRPLAGRRALPGVAVFHQGSRAGQSPAAGQKA
jgi:hypothetical protein